MILTKGNNNRCGIFLYYDRQGIVDEYVMYLLEGIRTHLRYLLVVVNGYVDEESEGKLNSVADEVMLKDNEGFDVGGYRAGIFHMGLDRLAEYDETILFNYTYYGPLYPFSEMFDKMDNMDLDFWGITRHYKVDPDPYGVNRYGYMPEHIQSHFMVLRSEFIKSADYREFITNLKNPESYIESICEYETIFTKYFEDLGYRWDTYVDTSEYEGYNYCPIMFSIKDMIQHKRCPIIKRRSFFTDYHDFLLNTCGESSIEAYEYIKENLDYNLDMVWDNLLRLENMTEISKAMHLNYMLPADDRYINEIRNKVAVCIYVESTKHIDGYIKYIDGIPCEVSVHYVGTPDNIDVVSKNAVNMGENTKNVHFEHIEHNDYKAAYETIAAHRKEYDIIGILTVADIELEPPYSNYDSWQYRDWENLAGTESIIYNVIATFDDNNKLGMLAPPVPYHGSLFEKSGDGWMNRYEQVEDYVTQTMAGISLKQTEPPQAPFGGSFWIRTEAMPEEFGRNNICKDKEIFLISLIYDVQYRGFYSGVCYNNYYAAVETTNYDYIMRELNKAVFEKYGPNYHKVVVDNIINDRIIRHPKAAGIKERIKVIIVAVLQKIFPKKLYSNMRRRYMKMRGWE